MLLSSHKGEENILYCCTLSFPTIPISKLLLLQNYYYYYKITTTITKLLLLMCLGKEPQLSERGPTFHDRGPRVNWHLQLNAFLAARKGKISAWAPGHKLRGLQPFFHNNKYIFRGSVLSRAKMRGSLPVSCSTSWSLWQRTLPNILLKIQLYNVHWITLIHMS